MTTTTTTTTPIATPTTTSTSTSSEVGASRNFSQVLLWRMFIVFKLWNSHQHEFHVNVNTISQCFHSSVWRIGRQFQENHWADSAGRSHSKPPKSWNPCPHGLPIVWLFRASGCFSDKQKPQWSLGSKCLNCCHESKWAATLLSILIHHINHHQSCVLNRS